MPDKVMSIFVLVSVFAQVIRITIAFQLTVEGFSNECRKIKVITLAKQKGRRQSSKLKSK